MKYHAPSRQFTVKLSDIEQACHLLRWSIRSIRLQAGLEPKGYTKEGPMEAPQFAESGILRAARALGIDLGSENEGELDVSNDR